jgi:hypothetical protein
MDGEAQFNVNDYLSISVVAVLFFILFFNYYHFFVKNDFVVIKQVACDPAKDSCFVSDCESNDPSCDSTTTYKKISVSSKYAGKDYEALDCIESGPTCTIVTCNADTAEEGERCFQ